MKIEFTEEEIAALPEEVTTKLKDNMFEGEPGEFIPDVAGLKSSLAATREEKKSAEKLVKTIADKFGVKKTNVVSAVDDFISKNSNKGAALKQLADEKIRTSIALNRGNVDVLAANVRERVQWDEESGQYIVPGEDGEPLKKDDGTLKGVADVIQQMKTEPAFAHNFARSNENSGSGSPPQKAGDGPAREGNDGRTGTNAPSYDTPVHTMTPQQRRLAATEGGGLDRYPR